MHTVIPWGRRAAHPTRRLNAGVLVGRQRAPRGLPSELVTELVTGFVSPFSPADLETTPAVGSSLRSERLLWI
jgi:hypothetical protein